MEKMKRFWSVRKRKKGFQDRSVRFIGESLLGLDPRYLPIPLDFKVECVFTMVISSESRMEQYRDVDHREDAPNFMILFSRFNRFQRLYRCWKRMLETKCFNEMLLTKSYRWFTVSVTNFLYKFCHNHSKTH